METANIQHPHEHDVLSGRGNFVNYHAGNEYFRALVRKYKVEYVKCPKPQKGKFSKMIYDEVRARNPPGRFLKQDGATKLWYDIGEKKALDKTRQALREGAPELMKEMSGDDDGGASDGETDGVPKPPRGDSNGNLMGGGVLGQQYMSEMSGFGSPVFQSPVINTRNHLNVSPGMMASPQLMSPNIMLNSQISPGMQQLSASSMQMQRGLGNQLGQILPSPQVHRPSLDHLQQQQQQQQQKQQQQQQISPQQQQMMMMNQQGVNNLNYQTTNLELEQALRVNQNLEREMQMMQNKLNAIYATQEQLNGTNDQQGSFEPRPLGEGSDGNSMPPLPDMKESKNPRVDIPSSQNSRRKPPPSLLVREESLKLDKIFGSPGSSKKKFDANGSSGALSAMSLSLADMTDEGNLSAVFDSSVKIVADDKDIPVKEKIKEEFDMSVATLGETGHMSFNTVEKMHDESEGNMSFSNVFEEFQ